MKIQISDDAESDIVVGIHFYSRHGRELASILDEYVFTAPRRGFSSIERIRG
jgi:hypothetical protein